AAARERLRFPMWRRLRKAYRLAEELSPRVEILDVWADELISLARQIEDVMKQLGSGGRLGGDRGRRGEKQKEDGGGMVGVRAAAGGALVAGGHVAVGAGAAEPADRVPEGPPRIGRGQPAAGGVDRQALPQQGAAVLRPDPGG